jgi:hypothetical protein
MADGWVLVAPDAQRWFGTSELGPWVADGERRKAAGPLSRPRQDAGMPAIVDSVESTNGPGPARPSYVRRQSRANAESVTARPRRVGQTYGT